MKRLLFIGLAALLALLPLAGCGLFGRPAASRPLVTEGEGAKIQIVATIFPLYDFAREIAKDKADMIMLLPPAAESHSFEPTPQDILRIQSCDLFLYVGGESDAWVDRVLSSMDIGKARVLTVMDCVDAVTEEIVEGMEKEADEEEGPVYDEHVWTSPKNAKKIVQKIADALCIADGANAEVYRQNAAAYLEKLDTLDAAFQNVVDQGTRKTIVFGDRFPFRYFADAYGLTYFAAFPGCATETEPSPATVKFLIDKIREEKIPVVFHLELSNRKMAETISEATGAKVLLLHACHNISKSDFEKGESYLSLMERNVEALKEALQ